MSHRVKLKVSGDHACFTRPEMKVERVSYDVMTPSAARGILESIHWKPAIRWIVEAIHVLEPIRFQSIRRNEVGSKIPYRKARSAMRTGRLDELNLVVDEVNPKTGKPKNRQQRAAIVLSKVAYVIEARFELTPRADAEDNPGKHLCMFNRRARAGQCFHQPCLGTREFPARFELIEPSSPMPQAKEDDRGPGLGFGAPRDLGFMLWDIDHVGDRSSLLFRASLVDGVMRVPPPGSPDIRR